MKAKAPPEKLTLDEVLRELEALGTERTKKAYLSQGAREPFFGVATGAMAPLAKRIQKNQPLADALYDTGNYDAMYFAGMIADPQIMTEADFERWIDGAYFHMLSDYVVAVTLAEADFAQDLAGRWIQSGEELRMSAGWACYEWLLGWRLDDAFDRETIRALLDRAAHTIHEQPNRTRYAMNGFVIAVGSSYLPLHEEAVAVANEIGKVIVTSAKGACAVPLASESIQKAIDKGRLGFKRRAVRC